MDDYNERKDGGDFDFHAFIDDPSRYKSSFLPYACAADIFIAGHFYAEGSPYIISREDFRHPQMKIESGGRY